MKLLFPRLATKQVLLGFTVLLTLVTTLYFINHKKPSSNVAGAATQPNIILIITDDQALTDYDKAMPKTKALMDSYGTRFTNAFFTSNLCCPDRASFFSGQYPHNSGVWGNVAPNGGYSSFKHSTGLAVSLQNAGYTTANIGKYLNEYLPTSTPPVPPGWDYWFSPYQLLPRSYYYYTVFSKDINQTTGSAIVYGSPDQLLGDGTDNNYATDVLRDKAVGFINAHAADTKPFFLAIGNPAPHEDDSTNGGPTPARRHLTNFTTEPLPTPPSFNEADVSDKPPAIQNLPLMTQTDIDNATQHNRDRLRSLMAVDEANKAVINALQANNILNNTYVILTSDNGYFIGQHRIKRGKIYGYEEGIRDILVMRGPGIPVQTIDKYVTIVDLAPTIEEWSGATPLVTVDGKSLFPLIKDPTLFWRTAFLVDGPNKQYWEIRAGSATSTSGSSTQWSNGAKESYNLGTDPYQLTAAKSIPTVVQTELNRLKTCVGTSGSASCWSTFTFTATK